MSAYCMVWNILATCKNFSIGVPQGTQGWIQGGGGGGGGGGTAQKINFEKVAIGRGQGNGRL